MIFPGIPTTVTLSGILSKITLLAPIFTLLPIVIFPSILAPLPIKTLFPIVGCLFPFSFPVPPRVTPWKSVTLSPIIQVSLLLHPYHDQ